MQEQSKNNNWNKNVILRNGVIMPKYALDTSFVKTIEDQKSLENMIKNGIKHLCISQIANNLHLVAEVIRKFPKKSLFLTYKIWIANYKNFMEKSIEQFLVITKAVKIDLVLLDFFYFYDYKVNLTALNWLILFYHNKLIRAFGFANASLEEAEYLCNSIAFPPYICQFYFDVINQHKNHFAFFKKHNITTMTYSFHLQNDHTIINISLPLNKKIQQLMNFFNQMSETLKISKQAINAKLALLHNSAFLIKAVNLDLLNNFQADLQVNWSKEHFRNINRMKLRFASNEVEYFGVREIQNIDFTNGFLPNN